MRRVVTVDDLLKLARGALPANVAGLRERGVPVDSHVFAFFNASIPPGLAVASHEMQVHGFAPDAARVEVMKRIAHAEANGQVFGVGGMFPADDLLSLLRGAAADEASRSALDRVGDWLRAPRSPSVVRVVIVNGPQTVCRLEPQPAAVPADVPHPARKRRTRPAEAPMPSRPLPPP